ncbi:MAG: hypothetical protein BWY19_00728 [bacterium ADurb.Bin212]|nr:MAG: hypothetical protein BWY19_00728 [bacterium ADurb.Bin212]
MQEDSTIKREVRKWNWGAFLLTFIWGVGNGIYISLLAIIPGVNIIMAVILGIKGNEWAWRKNKCLTITEFKKQQKLWAKWGVVSIVIISIASVLLVRQIVINSEKEDEINYRDTKKITVVQEIVSAINHYRIDHNQSCPKSISELVPEYLKQVPESISGTEFILNHYSGGCYISVSLERSNNIFLSDDYDPNNGNYYDLESEDISNLIFYNE